MSTPFPSSQAAACCAPLPAGGGRHASWLSGGWAAAAVGVSGQGPYPLCGPGPARYRSGLGQLRERCWTRPGHSSTMPGHVRPARRWSKGGRALALAEGEGGPSGVGWGSGPLGPRGHPSC